MYNDHCMQKASTLVTLWLHGLPHLPGTSPYLRVWSPPERARIVPVPNKWERPTEDVNAVLWVFMFRLQCIRSQTFLAKTKSPNTAPSPPLKSRFRPLIRKQNKRRRFRLLCLSRFPVMAVTTQHGYHCGHGFNYPVTSTSISEDFTSVPPIKRNEVLPLKKRKALMLSKHDFVAERCPEMFISKCRQPPQK